MARFARKIDLGQMPLATTALMGRLAWLALMAG